jgi:hypothetical protein
MADAGYFSSITYASRKSGFASYAKLPSGNSRWVSAEASCYKKEFCTVESTINSTQLFFAVHFFCSAIALLHNLCHLLVTFPSGYW